MPKGVQPEKKMEIAERQRKVAAYVRGGISDQTRIAKLLGVSQPTISRDMAAINEHFRAAAVQDISVAKGKALERLEAMMAGLWPEASSGKWLAVDRATKLIEVEAKILGYDAPSRTEVSGPAGGPVTTVKADSLPPEVRMALYEAMRARLEAEAE